MFEILDKSGNVIDTATSFPQASNVIVHLDRGNKAAGPHTCRAAA